MLRLVSFTNTVARFRKELDKTNLFFKLQKQCTVEVLNMSVKKMTLVDFDSIKKTSVFTCTLNNFSNWSLNINLEYFSYD